MGKFKNVVFRYLMLFACIGLMVSISNCTSDDDDDVKTETFLEKHDKERREEKRRLRSRNSS